MCVNVYIYKKREIFLKLTSMSLFQNNKNQFLETKSVFCVCFFLERTEMDKEKVRIVDLKWQERIGQVYLK